MVRTIYLMRHGKSIRGPEYKNDFERPLAERGKRDAVLMGELVRQLGMIPDLIISSSAKRALKTAKRAATALKYKQDIESLKDLYLSGSQAYIEVLKRMDNSLKSVMLVGHNPDMEDLVQILCDDVVTMPTSAVVRIDVEMDNWSDAGSVKGKLLLKATPKALL